MDQILKQVVNEELGIIAMVVKGYYGYHLVLKDCDSGIILPTVTVYQDFDEALDSAVKLAKGEPID